MLSACATHAASPGMASLTPQGRIGQPELDAILAAALSGDGVLLKSFMEYLESRCTTAEGLGGPLRCLQGELQGTVVEVLPWLGPEGSFLRRADAESWPGLELSQFHAAYKVSSVAYSDADYPAGEYALVFTGGKTAQDTITLQVRHGRIVRIDYGPGWPPLIRPADVERYLVPPRSPAP